MSSAPGLDSTEREYSQNGVETMLKWALVFLVIAIIAAIFGFGGIAGAAVDIAKIIFFIAIVIFVISLVWGLVAGRRPMT